jgi:hypothetical protein
MTPVVVPGARKPLLSRVVATVPVRKIDRGRTAEEVETFCAAIQKNFASIDSQSKSFEQ